MYTYINTEAIGSRLRRGRPAKLDRDSVLEAAAALLDEHGIGAVSMRRLAARLGISPMALNRHVSDHDELLVALVDRLAARLVYPPRPADPRQAIVVLWRALYDGLGEHSWLVPLVGRRRMMAGSVLGAIEEVHVALRRAGLSLDEAVRDELRGAPDPARYPTLAAAAAAWRTAHRRDVYSEDLDALLDALLPAPAGRA